MGTTAAQHVPGYEQALAAGLLPLVPPEPPRLLPGETADQGFMRIFKRTFAGIVALVLVGNVFEKPPAGLEALPLLGSHFGLMMSVGGVTAMAVIYKQLGRVGERHLEELRHGYTTLEMKNGGVWLGERRKFRGMPRARTTPWDFSGTWVLTSDGPSFPSQPPGRRRPACTRPAPVQTAGKFGLGACGAACSARRRPALTTPAQSLKPLAAEALASRHPHSPSCLRQRISGCRRLVRFLRN